MQDQNNPQSGQDQLSGAKQQAEDQINSAIDQFAGKVPGGDKVAQQAKDAAAGGLDNIEKEAENKLGDVPGIGGMFGGNSGS
ncbi:MAG: hypothetical protein ACRDHE_01595 [Ktedonobacterales bacterium]